MNCYTGPKKFHGLILLFIALFSGSYLSPESGPSVPDYDMYRESNRLITEGKLPISVPAVSFTKQKSGTVYEDCIEGESCVFLIEKGWLEWRVEFPESGFYNLLIRYYPAEGRGAEIESRLYIDGSLPFKGAGSLVFQRIWRDIFPDPLFDNRGNALHPVQEEIPRWRECYAGDSLGYVTEPYRFYFTGGEHIIRLESIREPLVISFLKFEPEESVPSYAEYSEEVLSDEFSPKSGIYLKIQGEAAIEKSNPSIRVISDRSSPGTEPYHVSKIRLNNIGGRSWQQPGQWISWEADIPEDGLYEISLRARQNMIPGMNSGRRILIDDELPFKELEEYQFAYDRSWRLNVLGNKEPYLFFLNKGRHKITLEVSLGSRADILNDVEDIVLDLNHLHRRIIMITGVSPDPLRDYHLDVNIPGLIQGMEKQAELLDAVMESFFSASGSLGSENIILDKLVRQLNDFCARPDTISRRLDSFKTNVGALGAWILEIKKQPLDVDYLVVASPGTDYPPAEPDVITRIIHEIRAFFASFKEDYTSVGNIADNDDALEVWMLTALEKAQILKTMVDSIFSVSSGINVNLKIVDEKMVLPAILSGNAPDVVLNVKRAQPVNLALRNAVLDISRFEDSEEIWERFSRSALTPYKFGGGVYALPEQEVFEMLFYRKDIFEELGLSPPDTWDDVYDLIPTLQKNHLDFGLSYSLDIGTDQNILPPNPNFSILLFQNGGDFYRNQGKSSGLDSESSLSAFKDWTALYTSYKLDQEYNFETRFRTGEMPVAIQRYDQYNTLSIFAPELRGLWEMIPVPGILTADGVVRRDVVSDSTCCIILESSEKRESSWEFIKWWTSTETQVRFGREMESLLGTGGRYPTANREAFLSLPWDAEILNSIKSQWIWARGMPEQPGGYFTGRHLDNAMRRVVFEGENPRETLLDYVDIINDEIAVKRKELGLDE